MWRAQTNISHHSTFLYITSFCPHTHQWSNLILYKCAALCFIHERWSANGTYLCPLNVRGSHVPTRHAQNVPSSLVLNKSVLLKKSSLVTVPAKWYIITVNEKIVNVMNKDNQRINCLLFLLSFNKYFTISIIKFQQLNWKITIY